jgi:hypothetical protein
MRDAPKGGPLTPDEITAFKKLGALFNPLSSDGGPCYDRDNRPPELL